MQAQWAAADRSSILSQRAREKEDSAGTWVAQHWRASGAQVAGLAAEGKVKTKICADKRIEHQGLFPATWPPRAKVKCWQGQGIVTLQLRTGEASKSACFAQLCSTPSYLPPGCAVQLQGCEVPKLAWYLQVSEGKSLAPLALKQHTQSSTKALSQLCSSILLRGEKPDSQP